MVFMLLGEKMKVNVPQFLVFEDNQHFPVNNSSYNPDIYGIGDTSMDAILEYKMCYLEEKFNFLRSINHEKRKTTIWLSLIESWSMDCKPYEHDGNCEDQKKLDIQKMYLMDVQITCQLLDLIVREVKIWAF